MISGLDFSVDVGYGQWVAMDCDTDRSTGPEVLWFKDRWFSEADLTLIREVVDSCGVSRQELAASVCELLEWKRPNGKLKVIECKELLARLEEEGLLVLPALRRTKPKGARTRIPSTERGEPGELLVGTVRDVRPVRLRLVGSEADRLLWRELVGRYHYLGYAMPFGAQLRYLIEITPTPQIAGCVQVSSPAWKMASRDEWIGWTTEARQQNLQRIVNNSRFLLLPWIQVRNLASHVLAQLARQLPEDWTAAYALRPLLLETLVDEARFQGTCYRAANWIRLGRTTGRGRMDRDHRAVRRVKTLYVYPLDPRARARLQSC